MKAQLIKENQKLEEVLKERILKKRKQEIEE